LTWQLADVLSTGVSMRYDVRPRRVGRQPTNVEAVLDYVDATGHSGQSVFPIPHVTVLAPDVWQAHLPLMWKNRCQTKRADVVFVIDTSSSMTSPVEAGSSQTKLAAAVEAVRIFLEFMTMPDDQASVITFDAAATRLQELTSSRGALELALGAVRSGNGTRIDTGLELAVVELLSARHASRHTPVIVLLTDGHPSPGYEGPAFQVARDASAAGMVLFAIGFGDDVDPDLLWLLADGHDDRTYLAPSAADLNAIYQRIAGQVLCQ
jgi:uncharacterized protein YegL